MSRIEAIRQRARSDTEFAQSLVRFPVGLPLATWASYNARNNPAEATWPFNILLDPFVIGYWFIAAALVIGIYRAPGHRTWRRLLAVVIDNIAVGTCLLAGGAMMMPVYAGLLWVTVGYGMRYGPRFLVVAIFAALITTSIVWTANPYWRDNPALAITLILTVLIVPTYAFFLHAQLRRAQLAAEAASLAKSQFLAQVSHDLRQPLHAVGLLAGRIEGADQPAVRRDIAAHVDRSVHDARELLQTFLDRSIIETGRLTPRPQAFDLGQLLSELEAANRQPAQWAGAELIFVPTRHWVTGDRAFVRTMLQNLIANALRVSRGRAVLVGCRRRGTQLAVDVADRGPGMALERLADIADPKSDAVQLADYRHGGNGLGLSIVYQLAEHMGLSMEARSIVGKGTRFSIVGLLPAEPVAQSGAISSMTPLSGLTVLLVGSDEVQRSATAHLLVGWGCQVTEVASLGAALPEQQLILLDLASRRDLGPLTRWPARPPLVILTAHHSGLVRRWLGEEQALIAAKPVTAAELRSLLMSVRSQTR
jgi:signal transduction histidine kinase